MKSPCENCGRMVHCRYWRRLHERFVRYGMVCARCAELLTDPPAAHREEKS